MNLTEDYPRINQFQEWFIVEPTVNYRLIVPEKPDKKIKGSKLIHGVKIRLAAAESLPILVEKKITDKPDQRGTH